MAIISASDFKTYRGITVSTYDTLIGVLIAGAQAEAEKWCGRTFDTATFTEYYDGSGSEIVVLNNTPIASITSITIVAPDGSADALDSDTYAVDLYSGVVKFEPVATYRYAVDDYGERTDNDWITSPKFVKGHQTVKVIYVGGYSSGTMPADLKMAMYRYVDALYSETYATGGSPAGYQSETLGDYSYTKPTGSSKFLSGPTGLVSMRFAEFASLFQPWRRGYIL